MILVATITDWEDNPKYIVETSGLGLHHSLKVQLAPELEDTATVFFSVKEHQQHLQGDSALEIPQKVRTASYSDL